MTNALTSRTCDELGLDREIFLDQALRQPGQQLAVDANGRFDLQTAIDYGKALSAYPLFWYEEAGDPLDYELQARLGESYQGSLATGENLFSMQDARNLIRHGGMRVPTGTGCSLTAP